MRENTEFGVAAALLNAVSGQVLADRRERVSASLDKLITLIPEPEIWTVVSDTGGASAHLLVDRKLFTLSLKINNQSQAYALEAASHPLDDRVATVSGEHGPLTGC